MAERGTVVFIGSGNMAGALIEGLIRSGTRQAAQLRATDVRRERLAELRHAHGVEVFEDNRLAVEGADTVVLAVKPQGIGPALDDVAASLPPRTRVVSIAAGVTIRALEGRLPPGAHVVRAMPNTPALVGAGATALARGSTATDDDMRVSRELFEAVGRVVEVEEPQLDVVTGLSGSGPAYVFAFVEALAEAGEGQGLAPQDALDLAAQTVFGAGRLLKESGRSPADLRRDVSSPGGTTLAGLEALEGSGFRACVEQAVRRAVARARELGLEAEKALLTPRKG